MPFTKFCTPAHISPVGRAKVSVLTKVLNLKELRTTMMTGITQRIQTMAITTVIIFLCRRSADRVRIFFSFITAVPPYCG